VPAGSYYPAGDFAFFVRSSSFRRSLGRNPLSIEISVDFDREALRASVPSTNTPPAPFRKLQGADSLAQAKQRFRELACFGTPACELADLYTPTELRRSNYSVRYLKFAQGTPFPEIVETLRELLKAPELRGSLVMVD
jgi:hypothetical protein